MSLAALLATVGACGSDGPDGVDKSADFEAGYIHFFDGSAARRAIGLYTQSTAVSVSGGGLSLVLERDESGESVVEKIKSGQFPIYVALGQRGATTSLAQYLPPGRTYTSDERHTGQAVILGIEKGQIKGTFQVQLRDTSGGLPLFLDAGEFLVPPAP